jgi:hypothetical protein
MASLAMLVLALGVFIGGAFGPRSADTLADTGDQSIIVVAGRPTASAPSAPSPAGPDSANVFRDSSPDESSAEPSGSTSAPRSPSPSLTDRGNRPAAAAAPDQGIANAPPSGDLAPGAGVTAPRLPAIKHVFTIVLSGQNFGALFGPRAASPYLARQLTAQGTLLSDYYGVAHGGLAGRIALISGQAPTPQIRADCPTFAEAPPAPSGRPPSGGCVYPRPTPSLGDQLSSQALSWRAYMQGMDAPGKPATCRHPAIGSLDDTAADRPDDHFATTSNPFVYFHTTIDTGDCAANVVGLPRLTADLTSAPTTPNYAFLAPDRCHDGRDQPCADGQLAGIAATETFLRQWVPAILASPAYKQDGLLVITADQAPATGPEADSRGCCTAAGARRPSRGGGRVGALLLSRYVRADKVVGTPYNHYGLLRTIEDLFGLKHLGHAGDETTKAFGPEVFPLRLRAAGASR